MRHLRHRHVRVRTIVNVLSVNVLVCAIDMLGSASEGLHSGHSNSDDSSKDNSDSSDSDGGKDLEDGKLAIVAAGTSLAIEPAASSNTLEVLDKKKLAKRVEPYVLQCKHLEPVIMKYGYAHIRKHAEPGHFVSIRRISTTNLFTNFTEYARPRVKITEELISELSEGAPNDDAVNKLLSMAQIGQPKVETDFSIDCTALAVTDTQQDGNPRNVDFYSVSHLNPSGPVGQEGNDLQRFGNEDLIVTKLLPLFIDLYEKSVYVWTEAVSLVEDVAVLHHTDDFLRHAIGWTPDTSKYYYSSSWRLDCPINDALKCLKSLIDVAGYELNLTLSVNRKECPGDHEAFVELARTQIVQCRGQSETTSTWALNKFWSAMSEAVTRLRFPRKLLAPNPSLQPDAMSVIDLIGSLHAQGWTHKVWTDRKTQQPPPVTITTKPKIRPKVWYTKPADNHNEATVSRYYLLVLVRLEELAKVSSDLTEVQHFQKEEYYKEILGMKFYTRARGKNILKSALEDDVGLQCLQDAADAQPKGKRRRAAMALTDSVAAAPSSSTRKATGKKKRGGLNEKSFEWGAALISHSQKKTGDII